MAGPFPARKRKKRSAKVRNSMRVGVLLIGLTAVNVYVFCFREDTAVKQLMEPSSTSRSMADEQSEALQASVAKAGGKTAKPTIAQNAGTTPAGAILPPSGAATATSPDDPRTTEGKIGGLDTLGTVLGREGFGAAAIKVTTALGKLVDLRSIRAGETYVVARDEQGAPESFEYQPTPALRYLVVRDDAGAWTARKEEKPLESKTESAAGVIESSLYESIHKAGESAALVSLLVDIFAWDINFYVDTHPGDTWRVVVEKQYLGGQLYKYGRVVAAEYSGRVGTYRAFYWAPTAKAPGRYFDEKGQAIAKTLLKCPLRFVRVSSKFDPKRFHPVLHTTKAHLGVDYAAPTGTPVWASATGKVVECGPKRGSGNTVVINHGGGLATRYYHLSRFAKGLKAGMRVNQKEVIGFVGTTGLSTGPHLHFGVTQNGGFVDPFKMKMGREAPVSDRAGYLAAIRPRLSALKALDSALAKN